MISQNHFNFLKSLFSQILTLCQIIALKFFRYPPVSSWVSANMEFERETFEFIIDPRFSFTNDCIQIFAKYYLLFYRPSFTDHLNLHKVEWLMPPTAAKVVWILLPYGIGNYVDICFGAVGYCCNIYLLISGKVECDLWSANAVISGKMRS